MDVKIQLILLVNILGIQSLTLDPSPGRPSNILLIVPVVPGMFSHVGTMADLGLALLARGHNVSWILPDSHLIPQKYKDMPFKQVFCRKNLNKNVLFRGIHDDRLLAITP